jgi:FKBP-type peptidyl-prolyl cis-trans isomerase
VVIFDITLGDGVRANDSSIVEVIYKITVLGGQVVDENSWREGRSVELKVGELILGLGEAVKSMGQGSEVRAFVPSRLAYGKEGAPPIPGGAALEVWIKMKKITNPPLDAAAEKKEQLPATKK